MNKLLLYPLSWLYGLVIYLRNQFYDMGILKSTEFDVPVVSIGNITAGGTGKTPHVELLIRLLKDKFEVAALSRGYKRKTSGYKIVEETSKSYEVGDEPLQIKKKFPEINVSVCENRVKGVEVLLNDKNKTVPDVVLLDDAFQHRRITPGLNILLIDYNRPLKEDTLLPAGRLREGKNQIRRANIIVFTKCPSEITPIMRRIMQKEVQLKPYQKLFFTTFEYQPLLPVFGGKKLTDKFFADKDFGVLLVTGIASSSQIYKYIKNNLTNKIESIRFRDHHYYSERDVQTIMDKFASLNTKKKIIVTTEKDAVRFLDFQDLDDEFEKSLYCLPVMIQFLDQEGKAFNKKILDYVGENKSNRELYKRKNKSGS